jgi:hypothetical protein
MPIPFPAVEPTAFAFVMPRHPVTSAVSESGVQDHRLWGTVAVDGALELEFRNIKTEVATSILQTFHTSYSGTLPLDLPDILFAGETAADRAFIDSVTTEAGLQWFWPVGQNAPNPRKSLTYKNRCTLSVRLEARLQNTIDLTPPTPLLTLAADTGVSATDGITSNGVINVAGILAGSTWQYSTNQGASWTTGSGTSFTLAAGTYANNSVRARQTDRFGSLSLVGIYQGELVVYAPFVIPSHPKVGISVSGTRGRAAYPFTRVRFRIPNPYVFIQGGSCQFQYNQPAEPFGLWQNLPSPPTGLRLEAPTGTCPLNDPGPSSIKIFVVMENGQEEQHGNLSVQAGIVGVSFEYEFDTPDPKPGPIP